MAGPAPRVTIAKPPRHAATNGVPPVSAAATQVNASKGREPKAIGPRLKVVIRRLPPGLTRTEFEESLGPEWQLRGSLVDWKVYKPGKVSADPAKLSRPSRAYLHLTDSSHLVALSTKVRQTSFHDASSTWNSTALLGPPSVEFAPYGRISSSKRRADARQGTIDQDPEFILFLESLTNPAASKPSLGETGNETISKKDDKITVTPLVQYLKDKKANKGKDGTSSAKSSKSGHSDSRDRRGDKIAEKKSPSKNMKILSSEQRKGAKEGRHEKPVKESVKVLKKETVSKNAKGQGAAGTAGASSGSTAAASTTTSAPSERRRERGNASAAAKILQRDLGIGPGSAGRRASKKEAVENSSAGTKANSSHGRGSTKGQQVSAQNTSKSNTINHADGTASRDAGTPIADQASADHNGPRSTTKEAGPSAILKRGSNTNAATTSTTTDQPSATGPKASSRKDVSTTSPSAALSANPASGTQAFLKHANPSQGITESLLKSSMEAFGTVTKVEIDKKKGFAYVDFTEPNGLQKAMQNSPVKVAEGQVVVLEKKERASTPAAGARTSRNDRGRGGHGGGRGGRGKGRGESAKGGPNNASANGADGSAPPASSVAKTG